MTKHAHEAPTPVWLGVSPAGVEWFVYPKGGETAESFEARVAIGRERLGRDVALAQEDATREESVESMTAADEALACAETVEVPVDLLANLREAAEKLDVRGGRRIRREILAALAEVGGAS